MKPLRIMHISTRLILGGSQENTLLSCAGQSDDGNTVSLVYGPIYGPEGSMLDRAQAHGGIETIETPHLVRQLSPRRDWLCQRDLRTLIRAWRPDVVHTHSSKAGILGRAAAWAERVPAVIHTIHGLAFHPYQAKWRNAIYIAAEKYAARRCHRILCVAGAMRDQALAAGVGRPEQYHIVWSGMETEHFLEAPDDPAEVRASLGIAGDDFVVGTVSRLAELKGHDDVLDALGPAMQADPRMKLLWVGDGWWRDRLLARADELGVRERIITTGLVPPTEIPRFHRAMDVLIHASYREGLPRVVTQGMLSGLPVIAYDVDGTREVCIDGETGWLLSPGDREGIAAAVASIRDDGDAARARAARGRELCGTRFAARAMVDALDVHYREVLDEA
ncbi:MAG: glycosyltransferase family 4 protein [Phycisphaerales bacterium]